MRCIEHNCRHTILGIIDNIDTVNHPVHNYGNTIEPTKVANEVVCDECLYNIQVNMHYMYSTHS